MDYTGLLSTLQRMRQEYPREDFLQRAMDRMHHEVPHYDWVGIYWLHPNEANVLLLGPYAGQPTEHARIPFGDGVCGQVAETQKTKVVSDVSCEGNYIACSIYVKSEIVLPILNEKGHLLGVLDLDSHTKAAFSLEDVEFLEEAADLFA